MPNPKITWLIENFVKEPSYTELTEAVKKAGYNLLEIKGDYKKEMLASLNHFYAGGSVGHNKKCVIFNGSIEMAKLIRKDLGNHCQPVVYSNFEKYKCSNYYSYFGQYLFNDFYCLMSLEELGRQRWFVYGAFGKEALIFIRPDSGDKPFQAQLLDLLDLDRFIKQNDHIKHELILVSTPKNIKWEGRFIVNRKKEIISHSTYQFQKQITKILSVPVEALDLCQDILNNVNYIPDSVFCLDLCQGDDDKFYLLELTSFSSAGLYASDKNKIVENVTQIALEDYNKIYESN